MSTSRAVTNPRRPAPAPERSRHLEVVRGAPVPGRRPPRRTLALVGTVSVVTLLLMVTLQVFLGQVAGFERAEIERRVAEKRLEVEELELDVARMSAPGQIAARAARLGLDRPTRTVVLPGPVTAAPARGRR